MRINSIELNCFKNFEDIGFNLGDKNIFEGANGVGKSSIFESVLVCLYGKSLSTPLRSLISHGKKKAYIILKLDKGTVVRTITPSTSKITLNGKEITQARLIKNLNLPEYNYFLPAVFIESWMVLDYKDKRNLLIDLLPEIDSVEVFKKTYGDKLVNMFISSDYTGINKEIAQAKLSIESNKGRILQLSVSQVLKEPSKSEMEKLKYYDGVLQKIIKCEDRIEELTRENQSELKEIELRNGLLEKSKHIYNQMLELTKLPYVGSAKSEDFNRLKESIRNNEEELSKLRYRIEQGGLVVERLENSLKDKICQACGGEIDIDKTTNDLNRARNLLIELMNRVVFLDNTLESDYESSNEATAAIDKGKQLKARKDEVDAQLEKYKDIDEGITSITSSEISALYKKLEDLKVGYDLEEHKQLQNKALEYDSQANIYKSIQKRNEENIKSLETVNKQLQLSLIDLEVLQEAHSPKGVSSLVIQEQASEMAKMMSGLMNSKVVIETVEYMKDDKFKEVFKVSVNGIDESEMSLGQRMRLSFYFSKLLQNLLLSKYGNNLEIFFFDNASLITNHDEFTGGQMFLAVNTKDNLNFISE